MTQTNTMVENVTELFWNEYSHCACGARWESVAEETNTYLGVINVTYKCKTTRQIRADIRANDHSMAPRESVSCLMQQRNNLRKELEARPWPGTAQAIFADHNEARLRQGLDPGPITIAVKHPRLVYNRLMDGPDFVAEYVQGCLCKEAHDGSHDGWRELFPDGTPHGPLFSDVELQWS